MRKNTIVLTLFMFMVCALFYECASQQPVKLISAEEYNHRGISWGEKGDYDRAISDFNKALEINPRYAGAYRGRGITFFYKRKYDKAWQDVHKAQFLGFPVPPRFLKALREASGRQK